ncbi:U11/U12 small nuclear ribonucleoprotein 25 kDa protein-like protein [Drosera capensis]
MRRFGLHDGEIEEEEDEDEEEGRPGFYRNLFEVERAVMRPSRSLKRRSVSLTQLSLSLVSLRQSYQYDRLPSMPIRLTVVKLDGSRFGIEVQKGATVSELKQAVQEAFSYMPCKGPGKISWRHVWGSFCLSYYGEKLVRDDEFIKDYRIKDGDELHFVRHVSTCYNLIKKQSRKRGDAPKASRRVEIKDESDFEGDDHECMYSLKCQPHRNENDNLIVDQEPSLSSLFRGRFFYSRLDSTETPRLEVEACPPRLARGFLGCFRTMFHFYSNKPGYHTQVSQIEI